MGVVHVALVNERLNHLTGHQNPRHEDAMAAPLAVPALAFCVRTEGVGEHRISGPLRRVFRGTRSTVIVRFDSYSLCPRLYRHGGTTYELTSGIFRDSIPKNNENGGKWRIWRSCPIRENPIKSAEFLGYAGVVQR